MRAESEGMKNRCGTCDNCKSLKQVQASVLRCCGTPKIRQGKFRGFEHADDGVVEVWNRSLIELPCLINMALVGT